MGSATSTSTLEMIIFSVSPAALAVIGIMVNTPISIANTRIKLNIKPMILIALTYSLFFYTATISSSFASYASVSGVIPGWVGTLVEVLSYVMLFFVTMVALHAMAMSVTYNLSFFSLIRNGIVMTIGLLPQNIFFIALGLVAFLGLLLGGIFMGFSVIILVLFGFSLFLLVWTNYCQWAYDKFVNDKVPGAQKNKGIYKKVKKAESGAIKQYKEQLAMQTRSSFNSKPIKPITDDELTIAELPTSFSRSDIEKLNERADNAIRNNHTAGVHFPMDFSNMLSQINLLVL